MKKILMLLLVILVAGMFLACTTKGAIEKVLPNEETTSTNPKENSILKALTKQYEKEGLKLIGDTEDFNGYKRNLLSDSEDMEKETNRVGIFANDEKIVRSFINCSVSKENEARFENLLDILFKNRIPEFKDYKTWVSEIALSAKNNPTKEYHWTKDNVQIRVRYTKSTTYGDKLHIGITDILDVKNIFSKADNSKSHETVLLTSDGKVPAPNTKESVKESVLNDNTKASTKLFDEVFVKLINMDFEASEKYIKEKGFVMDIKDKEDNTTKSIIVHDPDGSKNIVFSVYNSNGTFSSVKCFNDDKTVSAFLNNNKIQFTRSDKVPADSIENLRTYLFEE